MVTRDISCRTTQSRVNLLHVLPTPSRQRGRVEPYVCPTHATTDCLLERFSFADSTQLDSTRHRVVVYRHRSQVARVVSSRLRVANQDAPTSTDRPSDEVATAGSTDTVRQHALNVGCLDSSAYNAWPNDRAVFDYCHAAAETAKQRRCRVGGAQRQ
jgi:hypothetical protein